MGGPDELTTTVVPGQADLRRASPGSPEPLVVPFDMLDEQAMQPAVDKVCVFFRSCEPLFKGPRAPSDSDSLNAQTRLCLVNSKRWT